VQYKKIFAMIFNDIKGHVNTSLGLVRGVNPLHPPCVRAWFLPTAIRWSVGTFARPIGSAFAFSQVNPSRDYHLRTHQILRGHTRISARAYFLRLNKVSHVAAGRIKCHAGTKNTRPSIARLSEPQWGPPL